MKNFPKFLASWKFTQKVPQTLIKKKDTKKKELAEAFSYIQRKHFIYTDI